MQPRPLVASAWILPYLRRRRHGDRNLRQSSGHANRRARLHRLLRPTNGVAAHRASFPDILKHELASEIQRLKQGGLTV